jgi:hypothetical protein
LVTPAQTNNFSGLLRLDSINANAGLVTLGFTATSNHSYTVQYSSIPSATAWLRLKDVAARPTNHATTVADNPNGAGRRFYRVVTPAQL